MISTWAMAPTPCFAHRTSSSFLFDGTFIYTGGTGSDTVDLSANARVNPDNRRFWRR